MAINQIIDKDAIQQQINALIQSLEQSKSAIDTNVKSTGDLIDAEKKLAIEMKAVEQVQRQLIVSETKLNATQGDLGKQMMKVRTETRELNAELQREAMLQKELEDSIASGAESMEDAATSIGSMQRKLAILNDEYSKLSDKQRNGDTGKNLAADITKLNNDLAIANSTSQGFFKMWEVTVKESFANAGNMFVAAAQGTVTLSAAMKALGAAMKALLANPLMLVIAALAAAIGPLVNKFKEWRKEVKENKEAQKELQQGLLKTSNHAKELQQATDNAIKSGMKWKNVKVYITDLDKAYSDVDTAVKNLSQTMLSNQVAEKRRQLDTETNLEKRKQLEQEITNLLYDEADERYKAETLALSKIRKEEVEKVNQQLADEKITAQAAEERIKLIGKAYMEGDRNLLHIRNETKLQIKHNQKEFLENEKKLQQERVKAYADAETAIRKLRIENSKYQGIYEINQYSNEVEQLRIIYKQDLKNFKGTEKQKTEYAEQRTLIFHRDVQNIWNKMRKERIDFIGTISDNENAQIEVIKSNYQDLEKEMKEIFRSMIDPEEMSDTLKSLGFEELAAEILTEIDERGQSSISYLDVISKLSEKIAEAQAKEIQNLKDSNILKQVEYDITTNQLELNSKHLKDLEDLHSQYIDGKITIEEYNEKLTDMESTYQTLSLHAKKEVLTKLLETKQLSAEATMKIDEQLYDIELALDKDFVNNILANKDKAKQATIDSVTDTVNTVTEVGQAAMDVMSSISDIYSNQIEKQLESLNSLRDESQRAFDFQMELLDKLNLSDEERSLRQRELLAEQYADELRYSKKQLELKQKQAKFDKATAITNATMSMGLAIMNAVATGMKSPLGFMVPLLVGIATATGLAQIAAIASQPIPQYEKGGRIDTSGPVLWGEKSSEVAVEPGGNVVVSSSPEVRSFKPGTMIYPSIEKFNKSVARQRNFVNENNSFVFDDSRLLDAIVNNKSDVRINIDENGIISLLNKSNSRTKYINKRMSL